MKVSAPSGTTLVDVLGNAGTFTVDASGGLSVSVPATSAVVLVPQGQAQRDLSLRGTKSPSRAREDALRRDARPPRGEPVDRRPAPSRCSSGSSGCGKSIPPPSSSSPGSRKPTPGRSISTIATSPASRRATRDLAMVFQSYALYPHLSVRENLAFGLKLRKTAPAEIERRVAEASEMLGLGALLDRLRARSPAVSASASRWAEPSSAASALFLLRRAALEPRRGAPSPGSRRHQEALLCMIASARRASTSPTIKSRR